MGSLHRNRDYLRRLPPEYYRGQAYVHWSLTMVSRATGWLIPILYYKFREILTHTMFRFGVCCPIYCCMPDHIHLLWIGFANDADQRKAMRYFRRQMNAVLSKLNVQLQRQCYDHVLEDEERERSAFENVAEYIMRNAERKGLVEPDGYSSYRYTGCLLPGYPEIKPFEGDFWDRFWRVYSHLRLNGVRDGEETEADE